MKCIFEYLQRMWICAVYFIKDISLIFEKVYEFYGGDVKTYELCPMKIWLKENKRHFFMNK